MGYHIRSAVLVLQQGSRKKLVRMIFKAIPSKQSPAVIHHTEFSIPIRITVQNTVLSCDRF